MWNSSDIDWNMAKDNLQVQHHQENIAFYRQNVLYNQEETRLLIQKKSSLS